MKILKKLALFGFNILSSLILVMLVFCDMRGPAFAKATDGCAYYARDLLLPLPLFFIFIAINTAVGIFALLKAGKISIISSVAVSVLLVAIGVMMVSGSYNG